MIEGSCLCGGVRYRIDGSISGIVDCHCSRCRKAAGGPFGSFFVAFHREIEWEGRDLVGRYASSPGLERTFCTRCGTALTGANRVHPDDTLILAANTLDGDPGVFVIAREHLASRVSWHDGADASPGHDRAFPGWETLRP